MEEKLIKKVFDDAHHMFSSDLPSNDFRLKAIKRFFKDFKGKLILDVGCGKGRFMKKLIREGSLTVGIDISRKMLIEGLMDERLPLIECSATYLPFRDNVFDYVLGVEVLQHIPNTKDAVNEMIRVLKPKGKIILRDRNKISFNLIIPIPNVLIKKWREIRGKWIYPYKFPFEEKWFHPKEILEIMKSICKVSSLEYLNSNSSIFKGIRSKLIRIKPLRIFIADFIVRKGIK